MTKIVTAIYEHGVIRPFARLPIPEHQRIEIKLEIPRTATQITRAIISIKHKVGKMLADSPTFSPLNA